MKEHFIMKEFPQFQQTGITWDHFMAAKMNWETMQSVGIWEKLKTDIEQQVNTLHPFMSVAECNGIISSNNDKAIAISNNNTIQFQHNLTATQQTQHKQTKLKLTENLNWT